MRCTITATPTIGTLTLKLGWWYGSQVAGDFQPKTLVADIDDVRRRTVDEGFEAMHRPSCRAAQRSAIHDRHRDRAHHQGTLDRPGEIYDLLAQRFTLSGRFADDHRWCERPAGSAGDVESISKGEGRIGDQEIERTRQDFVNRSFRACSPDSLEAFGREPVSHGLTFNKIGGRDDDAGTTAHRDVASH